METEEGEKGSRSLGGLEVLGGEARERSVGGIVGTGWRGIRGRGYKG